MDEFPANFFIFFILAGYSKFEVRKNMEKQADHELTVRLPVAIKKGDHYKHHGGKNYPNFADATASPPTCVMP